MLNGDTKLSDDGFSLLAVKAHGKSSSHICVIDPDSDEIFLLDAQPKASFDKPPTEKEFVIEHVLNHNSKAALLKVCPLNTSVHLDDRRIFVLKSIVDDNIQIGEP